MKYSWDEAFINNYDATHTAARISLVSAGHTSPDPKFYMERDRWPCYGFELILRGRGFVKINGIEFGVTEGDLFILQKDSKHLYTCDANDPWEKIWFVVAGSLIDGLMLAHNLTGLYKVGGALPLRLIFNQIYDMADNHSEGSGTIDVRLLARLLSDLTYELDSLALSGQRVHFPIAHEMKAILDANIVGKVSLSELCASVGTSQSYAIRTFSKEFGTTPHRYLLTRKLELAKIMLISEHLSIREISERLSFSDEFYFSTVFRRHIGKSPQDFRKSIKV